MKEEHKLSNNHPMMSVILAVIFTTLIVNIAAAFSKSETYGSLIKAATAVVILFIQAWWFSPHYKGALGIEIPFKKVLRLSVPYLILFVISYLCNLIDYGLLFSPSMAALAIAIGAGFSEEIMMRGVSIPIGMRYLKSKNKVVIMVLTTAGIFGAIHLSSLSAGTAPLIVAFQINTAVCTGIFFAAIFMRTGSILIAIIMHGLYDWMCFVTDPTIATGVMTETTVTTGLIIVTVADIAFGLAGLCMIRPAVWNQIEAIWERKWGKSL